ncbi:MAG TPA: hypothetical protein VJ953_10125 [Saprospiraceae bacterium]|nr:hypothetical protein [Saprospiraceae bacterium]
MFLRLNYTLCLLILAASVLKAQDWPIPKPEVLGSKGDYAKYESVFLKSVDWLIEHDIDAEGRAPVNAFALAWISGTDAFSIPVEPYLIDLSQRNPDLLLVFLGSWGEFVLKNPEQKHQIYACNWYALQNLLDFYENSSAKKTDKAIEKLLRRRRKDQLQNWLKKRVH